MKVWCGGWKVVVGVCVKVVVGFANRVRPGGLSRQRPNAGGVWEGVSELELMANRIALPLLEAALL